MSAIPVHLDGKSAPGQVPTGSVCYERNGVREEAWITACLISERQNANVINTSTHEDVVQTALIYLFHACLGFAKCLHIMNYNVSLMWRDVRC